MDAHRGDSSVATWTAVSRVDTWPLAIVILALTTAWMVLGWPWLSGRVTIPWDAKAHFQPQIQFLASSLAKGQSPFWTPYVFSGHPQVADPQSLIFSPFLLLAAVTDAPSLRLMDTALLLCVLAGAAALAIWFRDRGWHSGGAVLAGVTFAFGASMAWRIQHVGQVLSLSLLPVTLLCLERALARRSYAWGIAAGVAGALMVMGRDQIALLGVYTLIGFVVWHWVSGGNVRARVTREIGPLLAGGLVGVVLIVVPVILTALVAGQSNRPEIDYVGAGRGSLHPALLATLVAPDVFGASGQMADYWGPPSMAWSGTDLFIAQNVGQLYIGAIPLLLVLAGACTGVLWAREIRFFSLATIAMLVYALGWYTPIFRALHALLPGVALYRRPADATFLVGMMLAILAGYSLHRLLTDAMPDIAPRRRLAIVAIPASTILLCVVLALSFGQFGKALAPLLVAALIFMLSGLALWLVSGLGIGMPVAATVLLVGATVADLRWSNGPSTSSALPPSHYDVLEPDSRNQTIAFLKKSVAANRTDTRRDRIELMGLGFHWPNASLTHELENTLGYNPLRLGDYSRATGAQDHVGLPDQRKFAPLFPSYRSRLADMLGLRYIASAIPIDLIDKQAVGHLRLVATTPDGLIYENPTTLPRVLFATEARQSDFEALLRTGQWPEFDPVSTVLIDSTRPSAPPTRRRPGTARIIDYANAVVTIQADSPDGGWVVLNDIWQQWWFATIDGAPAPLLKANVLFRVVQVPPGRHTVTFRFQPFRGAWAQLLQRLGN